MGEEMERYANAVPKITVGSVDKKKQTDTTFYTVSMNSLAVRKSESFPNPLIVLGYNWCKRGTLKS